MGDSSDFTLSRAKAEKPSPPAKLQCEHLIEYREKDAQGKQIVYHKRCAKPAAVREIRGMLTSARAVLCDEHAAHEDYQIAMSTRGYKLGMIDKDDAQCVQVRLPGIGVQK